MKAVKKNRQYTITEADQKRFISQGYDIYDDAGNCIAYGAGKTVPFMTYKKALDEIARLEAEIADLKKAKTQSKSKSKSKAKAEEPVETEAEVIAEE